MSHIFELKLPTLHFEHTTTFCFLTPNPTETPPQHNNPNSSRWWKQKRNLEVESNVTARAIFNHFTWNPMSSPLYLESNVTARAICFAPLYLESCVTARAICFALLGNGSAFARFAGSDSACPPLPLYLPLLDGRNPGGTDRRRRRRKTT